MFLLKGKEDFKRKFENLDDLLSAFSFPKDLEWQKKQAKTAESFRHLADLNRHRGILIIIIRNSPFKFKKLIHEAASHTKPAVQLNKL